ncbi:TRAP transporter small permease [Acuticoccus sp. M5D2P5]|uniref:TRAP transporter small permease n=1 Tax=Acuticoccus kalidii TaxID=2910977 RepID=UPI001F301DEC|nr:TRAP transporter small permease [Acuticoccus kalidii]MCF3932735.1 TRAP transporter small permease [Acuticoccus kalidii]
MRLVAVLERVVTAVLVMLFAYIVGINFLQVLLRYLFSNALPWVDETARYAFIWLVFLAGALATRKAQHIAITVIDDTWPATRTPLLVLGDLAMIVFAAIIGTGGLGLMAVNTTTTAPATGWSMAHIQAILPIFGVLTAIFALAHLAELALSRRSDRA